MSQLPLRRCLITTQRESQFSLKDDKARGYDCVFSQSSQHPQDLRHGSGKRLDCHGTVCKRFAGRSPSRPDQSSDLPTRLRFSAEAATGIAYLHLSDVSNVHGDMKAANVLLTDDLSVRICDFGMAEAKNRSKTMTAAVSRSGRGGPALTVAWSAPELFIDLPKSFASDVYALGMTLWETYECCVPFGNMPEAAVVSQVLGGRRPEMSSTDTPEEVKQLIQLCWSQE